MDESETREQPAQAEVKAPCETNVKKAKVPKILDNSLPNSLQGHEVISTGKTIRPKRSVKRQINHGLIDIDQFDVSLDKFPYLSPSQPVSLEELKYITRTLGFLPINLVRVAYSHPNKRPHTEASEGGEEKQEERESDAASDNFSTAVLQLYPLNTEVHKKQSVITPFPTMLWCFCPDIHAKVSILEEEGYVQIFTERLLKSERSAEYVELMHNAHRLYAEERWNLLSDIDKEYVEKRGWVARVKEIGIAGIKNFSSIKCLHCHYAHFLARPQHNNIVGQWVHDALIEKQLIKA